MADEMLDTRAAAEFLGIAPKTLENWRWMGQDGPRWVRIGRRTVRYRKSDLVDYLKGGTCEPTRT